MLHGAYLQMDYKCNKIDQGKVQITTLFLNSHPSVFALATPPAYIWFPVTPWGIVVECYSC